jgi:hypothetical protein
VHGVSWGHPGNCQLLWRVLFISSCMVAAVQHLRTLINVAAHGEHSTGVPRGPMWSMALSANQHALQQGTLTEVGWEPLVTVCNLMIVDYVHAHLPPACL